MKKIKIKTHPKQKHRGFKIGNQIVWKLVLKFRTMVVTTYSLVGKTFSTMKLLYDLFNLHAQ